MHTIMLDAMVDDLGLVDTVALLEYILPLITEREKQLQSALRDGDRDAAARYAHKMLGSVRAYGSRELETILIKIKGVSSVAIPDSGLVSLRQELASEFDTVEHTIRAWLRQNKG